MAEILSTRYDVLVFLEQEKQSRQENHNRISRENKANFGCIIDRQVRLSDRIDRLSDRIDRLSNRISMYT